MVKHLSVLRKTLSLLLAAALLFPGIAAAEERVVRVLFPSTARGGSSALDLTCSDSWFLQDAAVYQHDLCKLSLGLALASFRALNSAPETDILRFFSDLGFSSPLAIQYDVMRKDTIATAMAFRWIESEKGAFPLVAIGVCGGMNYGDEWFSNFDMGDGDIHRGFLSSARQVVDRVRDYLAANGLEEQSAAFWLSGFSRGAAVVNLTAGLLAEDGLAEDSRIFAYTFATPHTVRGDLIGRHPNIFNIVNPNDLIPQMPPAQWGYGWWGQTLFLPSSADERLDYAALLPAFSRAYLALTGLADDQGDFLFAGMAAAVVRGLANVIPSPLAYSDAYQSLLSKLSTGRSLTVMETVLGLGLASSVMRSVSQWKGEEVSLLRFLNAEQAAMALREIAVVLIQHYPQHYAAWLLALPDGEALKTGEPALTETPSL